MNQQPHEEEISHHIRDLALDLAFRAGQQRGERNSGIVAAGLGQAFYQFLVIHFGPDEAKDRALAIIDKLSDQATRH